MIKVISNFMLGLAAIAFTHIIIGVILFVFAVSVFIAVLPYLILGLLVMWIIKAFTS